jgi:Uncharacterized conserved protein
MAREVRHFIADILEAIAIVDEAVDGKSLEEYQKDSILRFAVERAIEIISEASRRGLDDLLAARPEIEWKRVRGIGNVLRHEYHGLSDKIIWGVVTDELPKLRIAMEAINEAAVKR